MNNGWRTKPFEECIEKVTYTPKVQRKDFLRDGAYPIVSQEHELINGHWNNEANLFRITTPIVVFGDHTKILKYVDFDFVLGADGVKVLQPRDVLLPKFFFYQLQTANLDSLGYARHYRLLKELTITYPTRSEQQRIVGILDEAFERIATAKANAEKNLQNARALFESHLQSVFTQRGKGWLEKPLANIAAILNGYAFKSTDFLPTESVKCIKITNVGVREFVHDSDGYLPEGFATMYSDVSVKKGSIVLALTRTIISAGLKVAVVPDEYDGALLNQRVASIITNTKILTSPFLFAYLSTQSVVDYVKERVNTLMQPNLSIKDLRSMLIPVPPLREQVRITEHLSELHIKNQCLATLYRRKLAALDALKKSLLHQAFSGQL